jgi:hypothetical protein
LSSLRFRFNRFVTLIGAAGPMLDVIFTVGLGLALFLGLFGSPALLGLYLLLVLPVSLTMSVVVRRAAHAVMDDVGLVSVRGPRAWLGACIGLHVVQAPLGAWSMVARTVGRRS